MVSMTPPLTSLPIVPENLELLRARLAIERPLHWNEARRLLSALEAAWKALGWVGAAGEAAGGEDVEVTRKAASPWSPAPHGATRS